MRLSADGPDDMAMDMRIDTIVNYGDSLTATGLAGRVPLRLRIAGAPPEGVREGATLRVGWRPQDSVVLADTV